MRKPSSSRPFRLNRSPNVFAFPIPRDFSSLDFFRSFPLFFAHMELSRLRQTFLDFFRAKGHAILPSASLLPENDPTVLFTTAGMHPLVPYLLGQPHPMGTRLALRIGLSMKRLA